MLTGIFLFDQFAINSSGLYGDDYAASKVAGINY